MAFQQQRIEEIVKREVGDIILKHIEMPKDRLVTIMNVSTTKERMHAKVYISVIPDQLLKETLEILNKNIYYIQKTLNKRLKIKPVPQIVFKQDKEGKEQAEINQIIDNIE